MLESTRGPLEVLVLTFPRATSHTDVAGVVEAMTAGDAVALIDLVVVDVGEQGDVHMFDVEDTDHPAFVGLRLDPHTLLSRDDLEVVAESMSVGSRAAVLVIEHQWAFAAAGRLAQAGGELALHVRVDPDAAVAAFAAQDAGGGSPC